jgi:peptide deformylase
MAACEIAKMGDPILDRVAEPVDDPTTPEIRSIVSDMIDTLTAVDACGIAAPQIFHSKRIFTYRLTPGRIPPGSKDKPVDWTTMINPVVVPETDVKKLVWERCLSLPGLHGKVPRYPKITVKFTTLEGKPDQRYAEGWLAPIFQHEIDHLDGVLYPMRMLDLSFLEFNSAPGKLWRDAKSDPLMDPLFRRMTEEWKGAPSS